MLVRDKVITFIVKLLIVIWFYISFSSLFCWFTNPELSQMEVFKRIPKSFLLNFNVEENTNE